MSEVDCWSCNLFGNKGTYAGDEYSTYTVISPLSWVLIYDANSMAAFSNNKLPSSYWYVLTDLSKTMFIFKALYIRSSARFNNWWVTIRWLGIGERKKFAVVNSI